MKITKLVILCLLALCLVSFVGCGKKADENKPVSEVEAETEKMDADKLRSMAMTYKDAIMAKRGEVEEFVGKLKEIPITKMLGDEAKGLKAEIENLDKSASALMERFQIYYKKLKEKDGDLSGLEI